ncbi:MAG: ATP-binding cassette domain-containing protein [Brasilonema octagenarum HA4186-MV1]|jgi:lipopolysaccharide transport system ATP-binding protein|uniref:ABC transporter ATP-binding protein n=1 Tax=Brasilonema sennae CENA114 TaxID=415709 RepID=A0A856ML40_9CYAN|nr:ABC transporter ATP-binding protein [Brasilonema sennae]MBW4629663.1 ATP-binding cassette domain-containing protein [Brasilonema octagenarum HA4186-MV1]QDL09646.1 ABC transporter ATP-binding protein [Brasilonema sennae CENA114]QDL16000.1 ABC transporter ATP-binding protein [Brasilonema octagenarum UFV-E1]
MSDNVVRVENLGKKYTISHQKRGANSTLRDAIATTTKAISRKLLTPFGKKIPHPNHEDFWALRNVSFDIKQGEVVGIIGRNGAGKSTLLKILSRITEPTTGQILITGRVASLLEVGTGFHQELTGRENIFLNGAILGMSKAEIKKKFDEIVSFAEVEKFLDTPVKHYSSGMYVRLAFAIAAHLEPEILIVDEVLAVGDVQFQKKCLGKMNNVAKEGRTILFVTHNMSMVESLCDRGILLEQGTLCVDGTSEEAVRVYLEKSYSLAQELPLNQRRDRTGSGRVRVSSFRILNEKGHEEQVLQSGKNYYFEVGYSNYIGKRLSNVVVSIAFADERGTFDLLLRSNFTNDYLTLNSDQGYILCGIENLPLVNGLYLVSIYLSHADSETLDDIQEAVSVVVDGGDFFGTGNPGLPNFCKFLVKADWSTSHAHLFSHM